MSIDSLGKAARRRANYDRRAKRDLRAAYLVIGTGKKSVGESVVWHLSRSRELGDPRECAIITADLLPRKDYSVASHHQIDLSAPGDRVFSDFVEDLSDDLQGYDLRLAGFAYCAGYNHIAPVGDFSTEEFMRVMQLNLIAPWKFTRALMQHMPESLRHPSRVNGIYLGSNTAFVSRTNSSAYAASKGGLATMVRSLHRELAPAGFSLMTLDPGPIFGTAMDLKTREALRVQRGWNDEQYEEMILKNVPAQQEMYAEEVAEQIVWLMLRGRMFGGSNLRMDHGQQTG